MHELKASYMGFIIITSKSNFKKGNIGMANMHKKQRRQDRDGLVMMAWLGDAVT